MRHHALIASMGAVLAVCGAAAQESTDSIAVRKVNVYSEGTRMTGYIFTAKATEASQKLHELRCWEEFGDRFREIGRWVRAGGHRISFHASHFTILNSENPAVVSAALHDVSYMGRVLETLQLGPEHKIILHLGVATPTHAEAMARLAAALDRVPSEFRRHLVLENDEGCYSAEQAVPFAHRVGLPVVVEVLHHDCNPGSWAGLLCDELLERVFTTWRPEDGPPKMHFSTQDPHKKRGAHWYWVDGGELERFRASTRAVRDLDIMFEAKGKDEAARAMLPVLRRDPRFEPLAVAA